MLARATEQQGPGPARKRVLDRSRHLCAHGPDHLGADVGQVRMKLFCQRRLFLRNFPNRGRIGVINPKARFRDGSSDACSPRSKACARNRYDHRGMGKHALWQILETGVTILWQN